MTLANIMHSNRLVHSGSFLQSRALPRLMVCTLLAVLLAACAGNRNDTELSDFQEDYAAQARVDDLNQQLLSLAVTAGDDDMVYRVGPDDMIQVDVFNVDELSREYRVDANGRINMPLVGEVEVGGYSLAETERIIADKYEEDYLRNPQVSVRVTDYRSQQFTAIGSVSNPRVYSTQTQVSLLEALAMAGGLGQRAGNHIYLTDRVRNPETGEPSARSLIINVNDLMNNVDQHNVMLGDNAVINVPRAGNVFVEGAVESPGVYTREGDTTVLKAIAMAGGLKFEANRSRLRVLRRDPSSNEWQHQEVNFAEIRDSPTADIDLNDGDIVIVENSAARTAWARTWENVRNLAILGWRPL